MLLNYSASVGCEPYASINHSTYQGFTTDGSSLCDWKEQGLFESWEGNVFYPLDCWLFSRLLFFAGVWVHVVRSHWARRPLWLLTVNILNTLTLSLMEVTLKVILCVGVSVPFTTCSESYFVRVCVFDSGILIDFSGLSASLSISVFPVLSPYRYPVSWWSWQLYFVAGIN